MTSGGNTSESDDGEHGGVLVLRVWNYAGGALIGRVRWETDDGEHHCEPVEPADGGHDRESRFNSRMICTIPPAIPRKMQTTLSRVVPSH